MGRTIQLTAADGHVFDAYESRPAGAVQGAVVVAPEIFGVNAHIRAVADGYADQGWLALAPALFDRSRRGYEAGYGQADIEAGIGLMRSIDIEDALRDVAAALAHAASAGKAGIVGYCWGGNIVWVAAARLPGLACAVPYYGGGIPGFAAESPRCPVMLHFGERDHSPTPEQARAVVAAHPQVQAFFYPAGHGFNCDQRASFDADSAALARDRTLGFLREHAGRGAA